MALDITYVAHKLRKYTFQKILWKLRNHIAPLLPDSASTDTGTNLKCNKKGPDEPGSVGAGVDEDVDEEDMM